MSYRCLAGLVSGLLIAMPAVASAETVDSRSEPAAVEDADDPSGPKYPEYVVGGVISLAAAGAFAVGGAIATGDGSPQTATGLLGLTTVAAGVGVPLLLLGAADEQPVDTFRMVTGVALATPGTVALGLGGTMLAAQVASPEDVELGLPLALMIGGGAALVSGIIVYATGAGHDDGTDSDTADATTAIRMSLGPGGVSVFGEF